MTTTSYIPMTTAERRVAVNADVVEFVRLGDRVSNDYRVDLRTPATFQAVMRVAQGCNNFEPARVAETFGDLFEDSSRVEFGAEGSPVLYVHLPYWSHQRIGAETGGGTKYTAEERQELAARVIAWAKSMGADEISCAQFPRVEEGPVWNGTGDQPNCVRVWWD